MDSKREQIINHLKVFADNIKILDKIDIVLPVRNEMVKNTTEEFGTKILDIFKQ